MAESLEDRLRSHASAFDGLLSLIPAKYYYGEDTSDQWARKKQTKEQARDAKRAKLDPDASKSAKDVMEENARKRKREEAGEGSQESDLDEFGTEKPGEGMKQKKQKKDQKTEQNDGDRLSQRDEKRAAKLEKKKLKEAEKKEKRKEKLKEKKLKTQPAKPSDVKATTSTEGKEQVVQKKKAEPSRGDDDDDMEDIAPLEGFSAADPADNDSTAPTSPILASNAFDSSNQPSGSSSVSSIVPPTELPDGAKKNEASQATKEAKPSREELQLRVQKRLEELRAARHADGLNGKPAKNRQELMEARRQKEEQRKAHKKEMRQKAKEEEEKRADEAISKRFSAKNPGSLLASPASPADSITSISNNFSFGRVVFADGQQADPSLSGVRDAPKKRGPQDIQGALKAAEAKAARLSGYDEAKRADIEEKDMWLNAKKKAHGERVKDDVSLLKKALNRKEGTKKRSEKQWQERIDGVAKGKEMRQAKREENLRKRREEKGNKGKKKARPGFEGSFKSKSGGGKKK